MTRSSLLGSAVNSVESGAGSSPTWSQPASALTKPRAKKTGQRAELRIGISIVAHRGERFVFEIGERIGGVLELQNVERLKALALAVGQKTDPLDRRHHLREQAASVAAERGVLARDCLALGRQPHRLPD